MKAHEVKGFRWLSSHMIRVPVAWTMFLWKQSLGQNINMKHYHREFFLKKNISRRSGDSEKGRAESECEQQGFSSSLVWIQNGTAILEDSWAVFYKIKHILWYHPTISLLGIYPNDLKTYVHTKSWRKMVMAALFIVAKMWKQLKCPSASKYVNKLACSDNGILLSATKK